MQLLSQWSGVSKFLFTKPSTFFDHYDEDHGIGYPLAYLAVSSVVVMVPFLLLTILRNVTDPLGIAAGIGVVAAIATFLWVVTLVEAAIAHALLSLFGASGYSRTLEAYAFPFVIRYAVWWFPLVGIVFAFVGLYLQARGLSSFHDVSEVQAAFITIVAAMAPFVLLILVTVLLAFVLGLTLTEPTQPPISGARFV